MADLLGAVTDASSQFQQLSTRIDQLDAHVAAAQQLLGVQTDAVQQAFALMTPVAADLQQTMATITQATSQDDQDTTTSLGKLSADVAQVQKTLDSQQNVLDTSMAATTKAITTAETNLATATATALNQLGIMHGQLETTLKSMTTPMVTLEAFLSQEIIPDINAFADGINTLAANFKNALEQTLIPLHESHRQNFMNRLATLQQNIDAFTTQTSQARASGADDTIADFMTASQTDWNGGTSSDLVGAAGQRVQTLTNTIGAGQTQLSQDTGSIAGAQEGFSTTMSGSVACLSVVLAISAQFNGVINQADNTPGG